MAKICVRDCFIAEGASFKKNDIVADGETLKLIGASSDFEEYNPPANPVAEEKEKKKRERKGDDET